jgi:hypothetical protein
MSTTERDVTQFLKNASTGDSVAIARLWQEVQYDVHDMAEKISRREYDLAHTSCQRVLYATVW